MIFGKLDGKKPGLWASQGFRVGFQGLCAMANEFREKADDFGWVERPWKRLD
jgi:hypothetical protein